ncbi:hypothetical protein [Paenibacillus sp. sgz500992]|uniref:hypothetical protein n=1 Tax=Paenibacillus sp. sgz500992 TaxID=3242476 RepID=UPI0036D338F4
MNERLDDVLDAIVLALAAQISVTKKTTFRELGDAQEATNLNNEKLKRNLSIGLEPGTCFKRSMIYAEWKVMK